MSLVCRAYYLYCRAENKEECFPLNMQDGKNKQIDKKVLLPVEGQQEA